MQIGFREFVENEPENEESMGLSFEYIIEFAIIFL